MKLVWNGKTLKHVESGAEAESIEELMSKITFFVWAWHNLLGLKQYYSAGEVIKVHHAESGFAVECWGVSDVRNKFEDSDLFKGWLKKQIVHERSNNMKLVWNGKTLKHVESGVEAESVEELMSKSMFFSWAWLNLFQITQCDIDGVSVLVAGPGSAVTISGKDTNDVWNRLKDSRLFKEWLKNQVVHAYDFEETLEGVHHKPSDSFARSWGQLVQRVSYREWFYEYLPDCEWVRNTWTLHHKPTGIKVCSHDLWSAVYDLMGETTYVEWLKQCEWKAERTNDGWVNVTHGPTGMSISSMFDIRDCVETITGSKKYVDWVCGQVEFEEDDLCILWVSGWYLHVPTGKTSKTLKGLMRNIHGDIYGSTEFIWFSGCVRHTASGIISYNLMELITSIQFLKYLEDRVYVI